MVFSAAHFVQYFQSKVTRHDTKDLTWPKCPVAGRPGLLVWPEMPHMVLMLSHAWPSPLWAYNTFLYVLHLSLSLIHPFFSLPPHSILTHDPFYFHSILFASVLCHSVRFHVSPVISKCHGFMSDVLNLFTVWPCESLFPRPGSCALVTHDPGFVLFILGLPCILCSLVFPVCHLLCTAYSCSCARDGAPCTYLWLLLYLQFVYCISRVVPVHI